MYNQSDILEKLCDVKGINPNHFNNFGRSALMWVVDYTNLYGTTVKKQNGVYTKSALTMLKLLEIGADPYVKNMNGRSAYDSANEDTKKLIEVFMSFKKSN